MLDILFSIKLREVDSEVKSWDWREVVVWEISEWRVEES